jgi:hypothetical protein
MQANKVVVHDKEGNIIKGMTADFLAKKPFFHLHLGGVQGQEVREVFIANLKAVFFVKDFEGDPAYHEKKSFAEEPKSGKPVQVVFNDGEHMFVYTHALNFGQPGFFLTPADPDSNNERVFVVYSSLTSMEVDGRPIDLEKSQKG